MNISPAQKSIEFYQKAFANISQNTCKMHTLKDVRHLVTLKAYIDPHYNKMITINTTIYAFNRAFDSEVHAPIMNELSLKHLKSIRQCILNNWKAINLEIKAAILMQKD